MIRGASYAAVMRAAAKSEEPPVPPNPLTSISSPGAPPGRTETGDGGHDYAADDALVLSTLQRLADQELDRGERFSSRSRQAFVFIAGFFAVVQTVAFNGFASTQINDHERRTLLIMAIVAGSSLAVCGLAMLWTDRRWKTYELDSNAVLAVVEQADAAGVSVAHKLVELHATVLDERRTTNKRRGLAVGFTRFAAAVTAVAVLVELIYAMNARI